MYIHTDMSIYLHVGKPSYVTDYEHKKIISFLTRCMVGVLITWIGIPLALDSWWGLVILIPSVMAFASRIIDEEKMLTHELDGYSQYMQKVHYRLVPYVW